MLRYVFAAVISAACAAPASGTEKQPRQHGAHEHGSAELNLAWEGKVITVEFESPAINIVGFEHAPRTDAQKKAVQNAVATLKNANGLFAFTPEARCSGQASDVESELTEAKSSSTKKGEVEEHSEFRAEYRFSCENPDALKAVDVHLFKLFPKTQSLRAQIVSAKGQTATELKPGRTRLTLP